MGRCRNVLYTLGVIALLFFGIPIRVAPPKSPLSRNETELLFKFYLERFNKSYNNTTQEEKLLAFQESLDEIYKLNTLRKHNSSAQFGLTKFSDLTKDEFKIKYLRDEFYNMLSNNVSHYLWRPLLRGTQSAIQNEIDYEGLPLKVDWREKGVVTPVNNQKSCGACWAFSTVETMESMAAVSKGGAAHQLSVQQLIDCAGYTNRGCDGGDICTLAYWLQDYSVLVAESKQYPLTLRSQQCKKLNKTEGVRIKDFNCSSFVDSESSLLRELAYHGPVAVAVNALLWQNYLGGVIHYHCSGEPSMLNHAVQIVGYNLEHELPYYIARNSWGPEFGIDGYLHIAIGSNMCGIANEVLSLDVL